MDLIASGVNSCQTVGAVNFARRCAGLNDSARPVVAGETAATAAVEDDEADAAAAGVAAGVAAAAAAAAGDADMARESGRSARQWAKGRERIEEWTVAHRARRMDNAERSSEKKELDDNHTTGPAHSERAPGHVPSLLCTARQEIRHASSRHACAPRAL